MSSSITTQSNRQLKLSRTTLRELSSAPPNAALLSEEKKEHGVTNNGCPPTRNANTLQPNAPTPTPKPGGGKMH